MKQGKKITVVSRIVNDLEPELENICSCIELTENIASQVLYKLGHYDICYVQPSNAQVLERLPQDVLLVDYTSRSSDVVYPLFHANFTIIFAKDYQKNDPFITL